MIPDRLRVALRIPASDWLLYAVTFALIGTAMNEIGQALRIARFTHGVQVFTVYVLYMVPIAVAMRSLPSWQQYAYGLLPMCLLEFGGYALGTSYAYPDNVLDRVFGPRNFSLAMSIFFAAYFPLLNLIVARVRSLVVRSGSDSRARGLELVEPAREPVQVSPPTRRAS